MPEIIKNEIEARLYDEDWSIPAILVFGMLLGTCPNKYGVFNYLSGKVRRFFGGIFSREEPSVAQAIEELEELGVIRFYREGRVMWIRGKWGMDRYSKVSNNRLGAIRYVQGEFPEVAKDFEREYPFDRALSPPEKPKTVKKVKKIEVDKWAVALELKLFPPEEHADRTSINRTKGAEKLWKLTTPARERAPYSTPEEVEAVLLWVRGGCEGNNFNWNDQFHSISRLFNKKDGSEDKIKFLKMRDAFVKRGQGGTLTLNEYEID